MQAANTMNKAVIVFISFWYAPRKMALKIEKKILEMRADLERSASKKW